MPVRALMNWEAKSKRCFKKCKSPGSEKHKTYSVSANVLEKDFGCPPAMSGSLASANDWWQQKQTELDVPTIVAPSPNAPRHHRQLHSSQEP